MAIWESENIVTEEEIKKMLFVVQVSKGKFYSEVIAKMLQSNSVPATNAFMGGIVSELMLLKIIKSELKAIERRLKQTEFDGSAYMPLPTESQIVKTVKDVQYEMKDERSAVNVFSPPPYNLPDELKNMDVEEMMKLALSKLIKKHD